MSLASLAVSLARSPLRQKTALDVNASPRTARPVPLYLDRLLLPEQELDAPSSRDLDNWRQIATMMHAARPQQLDTANIYTGNVDAGKLVRRIDDLRHNDTWLESLFDDRNQRANELASAPRSQLAQEAGMYDPYANAIVQNIRSPGTLIHEIGHAIDMAPRENESKIYRALRWNFKPTLLQEFDAWRKGRQAYQKGYAAALAGKDQISDEDFDKLHADYLANMKSYNQLKYPAFGTYVGGGLGGLGGLAAGGIGGALLASAVANSSGAYPVALPFLGASLGASLGAAAGIPSGGLLGRSWEYLRRSANEQKAKSQLQKLLAQPGGLEKARQKLKELQQQATDKKGKKAKKKPDESVAKAAATFFRHEKQANIGKLLGKLATKAKALATKPAAGPLADVVGGTGMTAVDFGYLGNNPLISPEATNILREDSTLGVKGVAWLANILSIMGLRRSLANSMRGGPARSRGFNMPALSAASLFGSTPVVHNASSLFSSTTESGKLVKDMRYQMAKLLGHPGDTEKFPGVVNQLADLGTRVGGGVENLLQNAENLTQNTDSMLRAGGATLGTGAGALASNYLATEPVAATDTPEESKRKQYKNKLITTLGGVAGGLIGYGAMGGFQPGKTVTGSFKQANTGYPSYQGLALQSNLPIALRRELTENEKADVAEGKTKWFRGPFASEGDSISRRMASPGKRALLAALGTTAVGGAVGGYAAGVGESNPLLGAAIGGGLGAIGGIPLGVLAYLEQQKLNKTLEERMRRLPEGQTTIRDMMSDPVTGHGERNRLMNEGMYGMTGNSAMRDMAILAALAGQRRADVFRPRN